MLVVSMRKSTPLHLYVGKRNARKEQSWRFIGGKGGLGLGQLGGKHNRKIWRGIIHGVTNPS